MMLCFFEFTFSGRDEMISDGDVIKGTLNDLRVGSGHLPDKLIKFSRSCSLRYPGSMTWTWQDSDPKKLFYFLFLIV